MTLSGTIRGKTIELEQPTSLPDGARVRLNLVPEPAGAPVKIDNLPPSFDPNNPRHAGLMAAFGAWSDDPEGVDAFIKEVRDRRHADVQRADP